MMFTHGMFRARITHCNRNGLFAVGYFLSRAGTKCSLLELLKNFLSRHYFLYSNFSCVRSPPSKRFCRFCFRLILPRSRLLCLYGSFIESDTDLGLASAFSSFFLLLTLRACPLRVSALEVYSLRPARYPALVTVRLHRQLEESL